MPVVMTSILLLTGICLYVIHLQYRSICRKYPHEMNKIKKIGVANLSLFYYVSSQTISFQSSGVTIVGDFYYPSAKAKRPAILILHGASMWGRKLALYRLMAKRLARHGYAVLAIDVRGFGDSDDPPSLDDLSSLDSSQDVINAITYLTSLPHIDQNRIYLLGHSMGARLAISVGSTDRRVRKIVAIGPPRRVKEIITTDLHRVQERYSRDRQLKQLVSKDVIKQLVLSSVIENYLNYFSSQTHKPIFLIDGELECDKDKAFLRKLYDKMTPPKKYLTVKNTGHYLSTVNFGGGNLLFYVETIMSDVIDTIDTWLRMDH